MKKMIKTREAENDKVMMYPENKLSAYNDNVTERILNCFDEDGAAARKIINTGTDDEYFEMTKPVAGMCKYARTIPIDFNEDGIAVAGEPRKALIFEGSAGGPTAAYMDEGTMGMLTDPVVIGTKNTPLGLFIPFTASTETLMWAGQLFVGAAVNNYNATNPNRIKGLDVTNF